MDLYLKAESIAIYIILLESRFRNPFDAIQNSERIRYSVAGLSSDMLQTKNSSTLKCLNVATSRLPFLKSVVENVLVG